MTKPIKPPNRATARLIKRKLRKDENNHFGPILWPRYFSLKSPVKQGKV